MPRRSRPRDALSQWSTPSVTNSGWSSQDFMFGAAMIIFQEDTNKIVVLHDSTSGCWFFPRGRKDVGESLETTAVREAYEESGYNVELMHHFAPHRGPDARPEGVRGIAPTCEPIFITTMYWPVRTSRSGVKLGAGEYLITWYMGQIPEDAVHHEETGMPDEVNYKSHLLTYEEACDLVPDDELRVLHYAQAVYKLTLRRNQEGATRY